MPRNKDRREPDSIVVDVTCVTQVDATSLRLLLRLSAYAGEAQCSDIQLVGTKSDLQRVLEVSHLHKGF